MKQIIQKALPAIQSFFIAWALMQITGIGTRHLLVAVYYVLALLLVRQVKSSPTEAVSPWSKGLGALFTFLYLCGDFEGICAGLTNPAFRLFVLLMTGIGLFLLFYHLLTLVFVWAIDKKLATGVPGRLNGMKHCLFGLLCALTCLFVWTFYLLKSFPGILTVDSMHQYAQIIGVYSQSNHHPWIHTLLIKLFYQIGLLFTSDPSKAIGFYTIAQMFFMAGCVGYLMQYLHRYQLKTGIYVAVLAFYALVPYNGAFAISMIKDTMFGGFTLLLSLSVLTLLRNQKDAPLTYRRSFRTLLFFMITSVLFCLFRSNGFYAFLFLIPFLLLVFRKSLRTMLPSVLLPLLLVLVIKGPIMNACGVIQPDLVENLSIPGQQISRVIMNQRELTDTQEEFLNRIMDTSRLPEGYNPYVSDWFKRLVRMGDPAYLSDHVDEFFKEYIELGLTYPGDYLLAFRDQTIGYWFPLSDQAEIALNEGVCDNEFGLKTEPVLKGRFVVKVNEILFKLHLIFPFYGLLWSVGALFWILLLCMCIVGLYQNRSYLLVYLPAIGIFLTLLIATPVAKDFRYAYGYVFCIPLYLLLGFLREQIDA